MVDFSQRYEGECPHCHLSVFLTRLHYTRHVKYCTAGKPRKDDRMPDKGKYFTSGNFLKAPDIKDGQLVTIEEFREAKTRLGLRPVLRLKGIEKPLGLNATNFDKMVEKFGENEKNWADKKIRLVIVQVPNPSNKGKIGPGIRIE